MNCSATLGPPVTEADVRRLRQALIGALAFVLLAPAAAGETSDDLDDVAVRMQYAFYTADARALEELLALIQGVDLGQGLDAARSYQMAYGHWKLAQLYAGPTQERERSDTRALASKSAQACMRHARTARTRDASMGEAYAIEAVCDGFSPATGTAECARSKALRTAVSLEPDNPRVQMIQALCSAGSATDPGSSDRWREIVESFEAAPPSRPGKPDWGHVEALTLLGESYLQRGDPVAARDVLERALVLAPDYELARQLLQAAAARPR